VRWGKKGTGFTDKETRLIPTLKAMLGSVIKAKEVHLWSKIPLTKEGIAALLDSTKALFNPTKGKTFGTNRGNLFNVKFPVLGLAWVTPGRVIVKKGPHNTAKGGPIGPRTYCLTAGQIVGGSQ